MANRVSWLIAAFFLLILQACSEPQNRLQPTPKDPSKPTTASIYYYLSGSLMHYSGDFISADQLYQLSAEQDPRSPQIKKQLLINAAHAYLSGQQDKERTLTQLGEIRKRTSFDADMLNAAYSIYNQAGDLEGQRWAIAESMANFPSARVYLQKFYLEFVNDGNKDTSYLEKALKLADTKPEEQVLIARMFSTVDYKRSLAILKQSLTHDANHETARLLADMTIQLGSREEAVTLFKSYRYPSDKALMLSYLQIANQSKKLDLLLDLHTDILNTSDPSLLGELAFTAYLKDAEPILLDIYNSIKTRKPNPSEDSKLGIFLFAQALVSDTFPVLNELEELLFSSADVDDILLYHTLRSTIKTKEAGLLPAPDIYSPVVSAVKTRMPKTPVSKYLLAASQALANNDSTHVEVREELCEFFVLKDLGEEADWTTVLNSYHKKGWHDKKIPLMRQAVSRFPDNPLFMNDLGYSLLESGTDLEEAGLLIQRAVSLEPNNPYYLDSLAWYYYLLQNYETAIKYIAIPMQMENIPGEIAYHVGMILLANHNPESAAPFLKQAAADTENPLHQEKAKNALKSIEIEP